MITEAIVIGIIAGPIALLVEYGLKKLFKK